MILADVFLLTTWRDFYSFIVSTLLHVVFPQSMLMLFLYSYQVDVMTDVVTKKHDFSRFVTSSFLFFFNVLNLVWLQRYLRSHWSYPNRKQVCSFPQPPFTLILCYFWAMGKPWNCDSNSKSHSGVSLFFLICHYKFNNGDNCYYWKVNDSYQFLYSLS